MQNLNVGNRPAENLSNNQNNELFKIIRKYNIDFLGLVEHGLNPRGLVPSQNWSSRTKGQLENSRLHLAWNEQWQHTNPQMWGGTGYILHGNTNNRYISSRDNPDGLGRWTMVLLRGAEGFPAC